MSEVRVRFAPSPTGELHVGGLRTALFNYLFARKNGGVFLLRIEDTDRERFVPGAEEQIVQILKWAGIDPDEGPHRGGPNGPYRQSERLGQYREAVETLIAQGHAYRCYCSPEELDEMRKGQMARGEHARYDGRHRAITPQQEERYRAEGRQPVVRMRIPDGGERIEVHDLVRGVVEFDTAQLDDQVVLKSDGFPTYHLAVVVDDHAMGITHILRAEEWLPSTPKHLLLYRWLGYPAPQFAHLPLLLNEDRSKMSKRKGDVAAVDYRRKGFLPEAMINFLALLGWSPGDDRELMGMEEMIEAFSIERVVKSGAVFDREKLAWMNQQYIKALAPDDLYRAMEPFLEQTPYAGEDSVLLKKILVAIQPALVTLAEVGTHLEFFFRPEDKPPAPKVAEILRNDQSRAVFRAFREQAGGMESLDRDTFMAVMKEVQKQTNIKGKDLWAPMRSAITLEEEGPDLFLVVEVFGKEKTLARINRALSA